MSDFKYEVLNDFDYVIEETNNMSTNLRKVAYGDGEPKVDIRKWFYKDGEEKMGKGVTMSEDGANELVVALCDAGYGDTKQIIDKLKTRDDFQDALNGKNDIVIDNDSDEGYYDPKKLITDDSVA